MRLIMLTRATSPLSFVLHFCKCDSDRELNKADSEAAENFEI